MNYDEDAPFDVGQYRKMQVALPGVNALYTLMQAHMEVALPGGGQVLVVGAGGGREIEVLLGSETAFEIVGVDPSEKMLRIARWYAERSARRRSLELVKGLTGDIPKPAGGFAAATSMLVMHFLPDDASDGGKLAFLKSIRERLGANALLVHADVSFEQDQESIEPVFLRHAHLAGLTDGAANACPGTIATLPIIGATRTAELFQAAGFSVPELFFQTLWYRAWTARALTID